MSTKIHVAHSPDADDAFMFYALFNGKVDCGDIEFVDVREDIQTLNQKALEGGYEVSAISLHAFPSLEDKYRLLSTGACFGDKYGPVVVAVKNLKAKQLLRVRIGIPGKLTTAFLVLKLYEHHLAGESKSGICYSEVPFDQIVEQIQSGKLDAGLIIHEGQLNYLDKGLHKVVDLGEWWHKETALPLPLGGIVIRKDLPENVQEKIAQLIQASIRYALEHQEECVQAALPFARGLDAERTAKFISMYVNDMTVEWGRAGWKAIKTLLERGYREGVLKRSVDLEEAVLDLRHIKTTAASSPSILPSSPEDNTPTEETTLPISESSLANGGRSPSAVSDDASASQMGSNEGRAVSPLVPNDEEATIKDDEDTFKIEN